MPEVESVNRELNRTGVDVEQYWGLYEKIAVYAEVSVVENV